MAITPINAPDTGGQRGFYNKYPYTDFHELNLDFLLTAYTSLIDKVNETIAWCNEHQTEYEEAIARLTAVENEINTFEDQIRAEFAQLKADIDADFAQQKAELAAALAATEAQVAQQIELLTNEVNAAIAAFDIRFNELDAYIRSELVSVKLQVNEMLGQLDQRIIDNNAFIFDYVENRLDQFVKDFPTIIGIQVYNPIKGAYTSLQIAINDLYDASCVDGITAIQFDELNITAQEFDNLDITAREFDQHSYYLLGYPDPRYYMYDPFTGEVTLVKTVVQKLAALHTGEYSVDVDTFDNVLDLTAEEFDATDITAFNFDWYSETILTA